jgi:PAS domain S-box-containing protein
MAAAKTRSIAIAISGDGLPSQVYRLIADTIPHMVWTARPDGSVDYVNRRVFEYTGKRPEETEGFGWQPLVHPQDLPFFLTRWGQAVKSGAPYENQYRLRRADGEYRWHLAAAQPLKDPAGRIMKWFGTCTDVEDQMRAAQVLARRRDELPPSRMKAERERWESEERLRSLISLSSDFFWETDAEHRFTVLEPGGRFDLVMFVATRLGKTRWEVPSVLPDAEGWRAHRETLEARRAFRDFQTARRGDDDVVHHYSIDGEPFFDERGVFRGYRGVGREITARKLAERALHESNQRFRAFLDSMPAIAWIKDSRLCYVWISASYQRVLGKTPEKLLGRTNFEVWPADLAQRFRRDDERTLRVNGPVQRIVSAPDRNGSVIRLRVVKFPFADDSGALGVAGIGFYVAAPRSDESVADAKHAEKLLERLSSRERQVMQLIVDGRTSAEVAAQLGLSPKSVDTYRSRLMAKLNIEDLPALVKFAIRHELTTNR